MKTIIVLLFLSLGALSYGQNESSCNADNFLDFVTQPGQHNCNLRWVNFEGLYLFEANFSHADLRNANFSHANLTNADFRDANLRNANLYNANLYKANLYNADLRGANFYYANLYKADLRNANLTGANFIGTKVDPASAAYLTSQGISGFLVVKDYTGLFFY